eukprot:3313197-Amphidinium_carterae.2
MQRPPGPQRAACRTAIVAQSSADTMPAKVLLEPRVAVRDTHTTDVHIVGLTGALIWLDVRVSALKTGLLMDTMTTRQQEHQKCRGYHQVVPNPGAL